MNCLTLVVALAVSQNPQSPAAAHRPGEAAAQHATAGSADGTWAVLCCEHDGQKASTGQNESATIQGNVLTLHKDGKEHRIRLQFGANHQLTAWLEPAQQGNQQQQAAATAGTQHKPAAAQGNSQKQGTPAQAGQQPAQQGTPAQAGQQIAQQHNAAPAAASGQQNMSPQQMCHGVYINGGDILCLALDKGFMDQNQQHTAAPQQAAPATNQAAQPQKQAAAPAAGNQPAAANQAKANPGEQSQTQAKTAEQPRAAAQQELPNNGFQGTSPGIKGLTERVRQAAYGPNGAAGQQNAGINNQPMEQHGFVLILRREGGQKR